MSEYRMLFAMARALRDLSLAKFVCAVVRSLSLVMTLLSRVNWLLLKLVVVVLTRLDYAVSELVRLSVIRASRPSMK